PRRSSDLGGFSDSRCHARETALPFHITCAIHMTTQDFGLCAEMDNMYFLSGDSQASNDIRRIDWSTNPLGSPEYWPIALKTAVQMMLASHFPKAVVWGPDYVTLYNDAFRPILGAKGPCMGKPFNVIWAEVWHEIG